MTGDIEYQAKLATRKKNFQQSSAVFGQYADGATRAWIQDGEFIAKITGDMLRSCTPEEREHYFACQRNIISLELSITRAAQEKIQIDILHEYKVNPGAFLVQSEWAKSNELFRRKNNLFAVEENLLAKLEWTNKLKWHLGMDFSEKYVAECDYSRKSDTGEGRQALHIPWPLPVPQHIVDKLKGLAKIDNKSEPSQSLLIDGNMGVDASPNFGAASVRQLANEAPELPPGLKLTFANMQKQFEIQTQSSEGSLLKIGNYQMSTPSQNTKVHSTDADGYESLHSSPIGICEHLLKPLRVSDWPLPEKPKSSYLSTTENKRASPSSG